MNDKIESCFMDEQPEFFAPVVFNDREIAVVRALTDEDKEVLREKGDIIVEEIDGVIKSKVRKPKAYENYLIVIALGGKINGYSFKRGREGWIWNRPINFETVSVLSPRYKEKILEDVSSHALNWESNKDALLKN